MAGKRHFGLFEQLVLLAILQLEDGAACPEIGAVLERHTSRKVSRGALYVTIDRLEDKGLLRSIPAPGSRQRGGHRRRLFRVTPAGLRQLAATRKTLLGLWSGLEGVLARGQR